MSSCVWIHDPDSHQDYMAEFSGAEVYSYKCTCCNQTVNLRPNLEHSDYVLHLQTSCVIVLSTTVLSFYGFRKR